MEMMDTSKYTGETLSDEFFDLIKKGYKQMIIHLLKYDYNFECKIDADENDVLITVYGICVIEFFKGDINIYDI